MGSITATLSTERSAPLAADLDRMVACSPYRGEASAHVEDGMAVAVQALAEDASLFVNGQWVAACCGYIGNWAELTDEVPRLRECSSDAERTAVSFARFGDRLCAKLRGEFSLLLIDRLNRRVLAARDVLGCGPLFYETHAGRLYLASELRQVKAGSGTPLTLNEDELVRLRLYRYGPREATLCERVCRVLPGWIYEFSLDSPTPTRRRRQIWEPPQEQRQRADVGVLAEELRALIERAVRRALPERPFGVALSGGLDSTSLWATVVDLQRRGDARAGLGRPVSKIYPGMPCDERPGIALMARHTGADPLYIDASALRPTEHIPEVIARTDAYCPRTMYQLMPLLDAAQADGRAVLLTGLGPDEWLRGEHDLVARHLLEGKPAKFLRDALRFELSKSRSRLRFVGRQLRTAASALLRGWLPMAPSWLASVRRRPDWVSAAQWARARRYAPSPAERCIDPPRRQLLLNLAAYQSGIVIEPAAQLAASAGMQIRHPLLDLDLVEFGFSVSARALTDGQRPKQLLRLAMQQLLPGAIANQRGKVTFASVLARDVASCKAGSDGKRTRRLKSVAELFDQEIADGVRSHYVAWHTRGSDGDQDLKSDV